MDPTTIVLAVIVAAQAAFTAWTHYKGARSSANATVSTASIAQETDMAELIDRRIQEELKRQDMEIKSLKSRVAHLERIEAEYRVAQLYMATHGIEWPPPGAPKPTEEERAV